MAKKKFKREVFEIVGPLNALPIQAQRAIASGPSMSAHDKSRAKVLLKVAELEAELDNKRGAMLLEIHRLTKQVAELKATMSRPQLEVVTDYIAACKERDALQSEVAELNDNSVRLQDRFMREEEAKIALQSRLAECEADKVRAQKMYDQLKDIRVKENDEWLKWRDEILGKLAAAEAEIKSYQDTVVSYATSERWRTIEGEKAELLAEIERLKNGKART